MEGWQLPDALHENCSQALDSFAPPRLLKGSEPTSECTAQAKMCLLRTANSASAVAHSIQWLQFNGFNSSVLADSRNTVLDFRPSHRALPFFKRFLVYPPPQHPPTPLLTFSLPLPQTSLVFPEVFDNLLRLRVLKHCKFDFLNRNCRDFLHGLSAQNLQRLSAQTFCDRAGNEAISRYDGTKF